MSGQQKNHTGHHGILVAEDNGLLALELADILQSAGFKVLGPAASSSKALKILEKSGADVAVLDWNLYDGTSDEIARRLHDQGVPFVFFTSDVTIVQARWPSVPVFEKHRSLLGLVPVIVALLELARTDGSQQSDCCAA